MTSNSVTTDPAQRRATTRADRESGGTGMRDRILRWAAIPAGLSLASVGLVMTTQSASHGRAAAGAVMFHPAIAEYYQLTTGTTPPTEAQCNSVGRRCFSPQDVQAAYNVAPLYARGFNGKGQTIAIVDSFGSDTIASDLHVYDQAFGLQPMCGETGVTCGPDMPTFSQLHVQGSPPTNSPPPNNGTGQETHTLWALEVSLDVETAHAIAPQANILLV